MFEQGNDITAGSVIPRSADFYGLPVTQYLVTNTGKTGPNGFFGGYADLFSKL